jgi:transposase
MPRRRYPSDQTDAEWAVLAPLIPAPKPGGRPPRHERRDLVDAMRYVLLEAVRLGVPRIASDNQYLLLPLRRERHATLQSVSGSACMRAGGFSFGGVGTPGP